MAVFGEVEGNASRKTVRVLGTVRRDEKFSDWRFLTFKISNSLCRWAADFIRVKKKHVEHLIH